MNKSIVILLLTIFASIIGAEEVRIAGFSVRLPDGFVHRPGKGLDSTPGDIVNPKTGLEIHYDIGIGAGSKEGDRYEKLWKEQKVPFKKVEVRTAVGIGILLTQTSGENRWSFFGIEPGTCFFAKMRSDKDLDKHLEDFITVVSSIRPIASPPVSQTKSAAGAGQPATQPADKAPVIRR